MILDRLHELLTRARDNAVNVHVRIDLDEALGVLETLRVRQAYAVRRAIESSVDRDLYYAHDRAAVIAAVLDALGVHDE